MKAGVARRDVTPAVGTVLMGYSPRVSTRVNDNLTVAALALEDGGTRAIILSMTVVLTDEAGTQRIRDAVTAATGVPGEHVTVSCWQNHSGPGTFTCLGLGVRDEDFCVNILEPACAEAAAEALASVRDVLLGVEETESLVGMNRRQVTIEGHVILGQNLYGAHDKTMTAIRFVCADDKKPVANIVHYGAHPTAAGATGDITRDWPGVMVDCVEANIGGTTLFLNGATGDVGPRLANGQTTGDIDLMTQIGHLAGLDAVRAFRKIKTYRQCDLQLFIDDLHVKHRPLATAEHAREQLAKFAGDDDSRYMSVKAYWQNVLDEHAAGDIKTERILRQTITRIGDIVIVPFAGEPFSETVLRLRGHSKYRYTLCASTTNGFVGYFPTRDALHRGGYEVNAARAFSVYIPAENIDDILIAENIRIMDGAAYCECD